MQLLLSKELINLKYSAESLVKNQITKSPYINLKDLWKTLYKNLLINENNTFLKNVLVIQGTSKAEPGLGLFLMTQFACIEIIKKNATEDLKNKYLSKLFTGEYIACFALTEPNAGSDVSMIETTAKKSGDGYLLNGHKMWASNGSISDIIITFAQTKEYKDKSGITCFVINSNSKNVKILESTPKLGIKVTPSNEIIFNNYKINTEEQIGNMGQGIKIALDAITNGRIICAAQATGLQEGILEESVNYSTKRKQFGKQIIDNQAIQWYIADMTKDLDASLLLLYKAIFAKQSNSNDLNKLSSMAKYFATNQAQKHATNAVQIHGGRGLIENSYVAKAYCDSKVLEIYEGTNEIQKLIISKELSLNAN